MLIKNKVAQCGPGANGLIESQLTLCLSQLLIGLLVLAVELCLLQLASRDALGLNTASNGMRQLKICLKGLFAAMI